MTAAPRRDPASERSPGRTNGTARLALLGAAAILAGAAQPAAAAPLAFDCELAGRRIDSLLDDMARDARQYEDLKATLAARQGQLVNERQAFELNRSRRLALYVERLAPERLEDVRKNAQQARSRDCISEERLEAVLGRAKAEIERILGPETRP